MREHIMKGNPGRPEDFTGTVQNGADGEFAPRYKVSLRSLLYQQGHIVTNVCKNELP